MNEVITLATANDYELYQKAVERTREKLEERSRWTRRENAWMGEKQLLWDDMERIDGAALALEAMFGVHDFTMMDALGKQEVRNRFIAECDRELARERRTA